MKVELRGADFKHFKIDRQQQIAPIDTRDKQYFDFDFRSINTYILTCNTTYLFHQNKSS